VSATVDAGYLDRVTRRSRILAFGTAAVMVVAGTVCGIAIDGITGSTLALALLLAGLGGAVLLLFLEVGLSEEHDREKERERRATRGPRHVEPRARRPRRPRRPG
jgi:hypothetical protein